MCEGGRCAHGWMGGRRRKEERERECVCERDWGGGRSVSCMDPMLGVGESLEDPRDMGRYGKRNVKNPRFEPVRASSRETSGYQLRLEL